MENHKKPEANDIYRHQAGDMLRVISLALDADSREELVVYQSLQGSFEILVARLEKFLAQTDFIPAMPGIPSQKIKVEQEEQVVEKEAIVEDTSAQIDELLLEFIDSQSNAEKLKILTGVEHRLTDEMINTMAVVIDVEVPEGELQARIASLKYCLQTKIKYEVIR